ncbi:myogenesis-regulating glycosidase isoform X2 [Chrysoperla carnea]|uniref:myogenesis-regulating glycosidase isoform X2 n=1 Tax=Chrysoperla carnea TaxID=189513 RepID=UPI001D07EAED|nr:myogenesis-regulating glycosidase isoform X2 [Chrysoperla carnea]
MSLNRLNTVSVSTGHTFNAYPDEIEIPENETSASSSYSGGNDSEEDVERNKVPLRNGRRKSGAPKRHHPEEDEFLGSAESSPNNSITSVNSLASLLKEKMQMFPNALKKRQQTTDIKLRAFVTFLFLSIVFIVSLAYILYHQKVLQKAYFHRIKFNKIERTMRIFNNDGIEIIRGILGVTVSGENAYNCLKENEKTDGSLCFEWMSEARLYLSYKEINKDVRCYNLNWISLASDVAPTDCFDLNVGKGYWYGGGQTADPAWPLQKKSFDYAPFITGDIAKNTWGNVLKRYFISSRGVAIVVDNESPLHIAINATNSKKLCLRAQFDEFSYVNHRTLHPHLNYSICTGPNMKILHSSLSEKSLWDGLKPEDISTVNSFISEPVWQIAPPIKSDLIEATIYNYTEDVIALGFFKQGHVLVNEFWQGEVGDFTLDEERFQTLDETVKIIRRRGFRTVFSIQPFISTESVNFVECVRKGLLITERHSDQRIPALTRYKSLQSAGVLDFTKNETMPWLKAQLELVMKRYSIDAFYLDLGTAFDMPHYYQCNIHSTNPDEFRTYLINSLQGTVSIIGVSSAVQRPRAPIFVSLPPFESSWRSIKRVIPTVLTYGIIGYPFIMSGAVGGDFQPETMWRNITDDNEALLDKELYIRWLQLSTFLPVIRFTDLPSKYGKDVLDMAKRLTSLRLNVITPLLRKYARETLDSGLPLIRPLWMIDPVDQACHAVTDEFSIGEEVIVAPILQPGVRHREVYLPAGVWKDGIDGSLRKGSRWIHNYRVLEDQIAYFQKMPDNTRF